MIALVDCDNFYASCEAVFRPRLRGKPLVVLSNRDTCVVARSAEAKALGIPMAVPVFSVRDVIAKNGVTLLSSNYALYADMSRRVAEALASLCPDIEKYSVDESFLDLSGLSGGDGLALGRALRERVRLWTGIPVSVGLAATKTLAKVAARFAKKRAGVFAIDPWNVDEALRRTPIENVWGVAERRAELLRRNGIRNAREFRDAPDGWLRERLGIVWLRLAQELRGEPRLPLEFAPSPHKQILVSRNYQVLLRDRASVSEATAHYAALAAEKLRAGGQGAGVIEVFLHTELHAPAPRRYYAAGHASFQVATAWTQELIAAAQALVERLYRDGYDYRKSGVVLSELSPLDRSQLGLFDGVDRERADRLMRAMDDANGRFGRGRVAYAAQGTRRPWELRFDQRSPRYTTRFSELPVAHAGAPGHAVP